MTSPTTVGSVGAWLHSSAGRVDAAMADLTTAVPLRARPIWLDIFDHAPAPDTPHWLPPVDDQDVWAAGVTYERSRAARQEEASDGGDVYARVYVAQRPELFFKAKGAWVVGPHDPVGIRRDARLECARTGAGAGDQPGAGDRGLHRGQRHEQPGHRGRESALFAPGQNLHPLLRAGAAHRAGRNRRHMAGCGDPACRSSAPARSLCGRDPHPPDPAPARRIG